MPPLQSIHRVDCNRPKRIKSPKITHLIKISNNSTGMMWPSRLPSVHSHLIQRWRVSHRTKPTNFALNTSNSINAIEKVSQSNLSLTMLYTQIRRHKWMLLSLSRAWSTTMLDRWMSFLHKPRLSRGIRPNFCFASMLLRVNWGLFATCTKPNSSKMSNRWWNSFEQPSMKRTSGSTNTPRWKLIWKKPRKWLRLMRACWTRWLAKIRKWRSGSRQRSSLRRSSAMPRL